MCMLSFIPANVEIEAQDLLNGGIFNKDGSGWAIAAHDKLLMGKSMKIEEALDEFIEVRTQYPDCDALFHSRFATHGTTGVANVHPFIVNGDHRTVVGHNGILPCVPTTNDWRSDTRVLADDYLGSRYRRYDRPGTISALSNYIGKNNKLVILTVDKKYKKNAYIINENSGHWDSRTKVWHSNWDYIGITSYSTTPKQCGWIPSSSDACLYCGYGIIGKAGYCMECGTCNDCGDYRQDCQCWSGYYKSFDWDTQAIARKSLDIPRDSHGVPTLGYSDNNVRKLQEAEDYERAGMSLGDIVDQIDELENGADNA